ncbi:MAG: hypothetical protein B7Z39_01270 [Novosphingobium sp. 12-64-8]|nr:MAG: hypothetical protein B7Z39_01270 [Novosphingobium sp. 12-64-8]
MRLTGFWKATTLVVASVCASTASAGVKEGVDQWSRGDYAAAVRQWQGPAAKGDADALFNMGQAFKLGRGVPKDLTKAEEMYRKAAKLGHARAIDNYGVLLFQTGRQAEAMPWLTASADRGEPRAMYILGIAAFNGDLAEKDWVRAYALMTRAASNGLPQAMTNLSAMNEQIPLAQRQMGASLAQEMEGKAAEVRGQQLAAADLGAIVPAAVAPASSVPLRPALPTGPLQSVDIPASITSVPATPPRPAAPLPKPVPATPKPTLVTPKPTLATPKPTLPPATRAGGNWRVQLGAFGQKSNADALWAKLRTRPELAGHQRIDAGSGVTRLQAGGFAGEADASRACAGLKGAGLTCLVVRP